MMKVLLSTLLIVLLSSLSAFFLLSDGYSGTPYLMTTSTGRGFGDYPFGWPINGTVLKFSLGAGQRFLKDYGLSGQLIASTLWEKMPTHPLLINDTNTMVAYATDSTDQSQQFFLLTNGVKMPFLAGGNQTSSYGIDQ